MQCRRQRAEGGDRIGGPSSPGRLPPTRPLLIHFPQAPGARSARLAPRHAARGAVAPSGPAVRPSSRRTPGRWPGTRLGPGLFISLRRRAVAPSGPAVRPSSRRTPGRWPGTRLGPGLFISLRRRALAPLAWLRAMRRAARSRRPDLRSGLFAADSWSVARNPLSGLAYSFPSGAGRSLRSLGSAPCGARRGRAVRTCGPALFAADSWSVARNPTRAWLIHFPQSPAARALQRWGRRGGKGRRHLRPPSALRGEGERGRWGTRAWRRHRC